MLTHIREDLSKLSPNWLFDGELYLHGESLQKINSAVAVTRKEPSPKTSQVQYHIFDMLDINEPVEEFAYRLEKLQMIKLLAGPSVQVVETRVINSRNELDAYHKQNRANGYEGTMIRLNRHYGHEDLCGNKENRWHFLLKYKDWLDQEYEVLGFEYGEGKYANLIGALQLSHNGQPFTAGSGLTDEQRNPNNLPKWVRIKYEMLSDGGVPLKPTIDFVSYD